MKFYAVKKGRAVGVFNSWDECNKSIAGFSGADYKSFSNEEEAKAYISNRDIYREQVSNDLQQGYIVAYCDGSFDEKAKQYSFGVVMIDKDFVEHEICGSYSNPKYIDSKNISGEIFAAINALDWAVSNGYSKIKIYHDLEGLSKWASGEWETNTNVSQMYVQLLDKKYKELIEIEFEKVKGHSNNKYNEKADALAKNAIAIKERKPVKGDNWFQLKYFKQTDLETIINMIIEEHSDVKKDEKHSPNSLISVVYKLKLKKDKLCITLFKTGTLLVQGKASILFQIFTSYIFELVGIDKIEPIFKDAYKVSPKKEEISNNFNKVCEALPSSYPANIKTLLKTSIMFLTCYIESDDYSYCAFPALRALEGHMKYILNKYNIIRTKFDMFENDKATNKFVLKSDYLTKISDGSDINKLERIYNYYYLHRHGLGHYGNILGNSDDTRIISRKVEADEIIGVCLKFITEI